APVAIEHRLDRHELSLIRRIDLLATADVNSDVADARHVRVREEHQVAGQELIACDARGCSELIRGGPRQADTQVQIHELNEARAVHTMPRAAAEEIRDANPLLRKLRHALRKCKRAGTPNHFACVITRSKAPRREAATIT